MKPVSIDRAIPPADSFLEAQQVTLRFGGITALIDVSFAIGVGELFSIIGSKGAGKTSMELHLGPLPAHKRNDFLSGTRHQRLDGGRPRRTRHRPDLPESCAVPSHDGSRQHHGGAPTTC